MNKQDGGMIVPRVQNKESPNIENRLKTIHHLFTWLKKEKNRKMYTVTQRADNY